MLFMKKRQSRKYGARGKEAVASPIRIHCIVPYGGTLLRDQDVDDEYRYDDPKTVVRQT